MRHLIFALLAAAPAAASTPAAWSAHDAAVKAACIKAADKDAGLVAAAVSRPILFGDATGAKTAMLVQGRYKQPFMKNAKGQMLCLYDRRTKRAEVSEAKGWTAPL